MGTINKSRNSWIKLPRFDDSESEETEHSSSGFSLRNVNNFIPSTYNFNNTTLGISIIFGVMHSTEEWYCFINFFDKNPMQYIVNETNCYYKYCPSSANTSYSKHSINKSWSKDEMIQTNFFTKYITRDRFTQSHRYLH